MLPSVKKIIAVAGLLAIAVGVAYYVRKQKRAAAIQKRRENVLESCRSVSSDETIFVSVPSYRDPECVMTIYDLFETASCPYRVTVGLCQQNDSKDFDVMRLYKSLTRRRGTPDYSTRVRVIRIPASQAKGPMYARALIDANLFGGEKYYMCIDSHTAFVENWDKKAVEAIEALRAVSAKPVMTMYPDDYGGNRSKRDYDAPPSYLRLKRLNDRTGLPEIESAPMSRTPREPVPSLFWAACFSFADGSMPREVPFDSSLPYVFQGEEISMAMRLYAHGYDLYAPPSMLVYHKWRRSRPTFWEQFNGENETHKQRRDIENKSYDDLVQRIKSGALTGPTPRSIAQYGQYCGVDFFKGVHPRARIGVSASPSTEEIACKAGSLSEYKRLLETVQ